MNDIIEGLRDLDLAQTRVVMVDKNLHGGGCDDVEGGERREDLRHALHGGIRLFSATVSVGMRRGARGLR